MINDSQLGEEWNTWNTSKFDSPRWKMRTSRRMEVFLHSLPVLIHEYKLLSDFLSTRNLPDVTLEDFSKVDLRQFKWIHWEVGGARSHRNTKSQTVQTNVIELDSSVSTRLMSPDQTNLGRCLFHYWHSQSQAVASGISWSFALSVHID